MNSKTKQFEMACLLASLLIVGLIALNGCKKSEPAPDETPVETMQEMHENMAMRAEPAIASALEQTTCPVMGAAIDKSLFTEYQGKKVYFCCPGCKEKFEAEPEKYIAKLPQFSK
jgi:YHS domain-containing protein